MSKTYHSRAYPGHKQSDEYGRRVRLSSAGREKEVARLAQALWERRGAVGRGASEQDWQDAEAAVALDTELRRVARAS